MLEIVELNWRRKVNLQTERGGGGGENDEEEKEEEGTDRKLSSQSMIKTLTYCTATSFGSSTPLYCPLMWCPSMLLLPLREPIGDKP